MLLVPAMAAGQAPPDPSRCAPQMMAHRSAIRRPGRPGTAGARAGEHAISAGRSGRTHGRAGAESQAEVGVRIPRHALGVRAADGRGRSRLHRHAERHGLFARREDRLHVLDFQDAERRSAPRRRWVRDGPRRASAPIRSTWPTSPLMCTRSTPRRAICCGRTRWTILPGARVTGAPTLYQDRLYVPVASS